MDLSSNSKQGWWEAVETVAAAAGGGEEEGEGWTQMHAECGPAQTEEKMCLPRHAQACIDARRPTFKWRAN